MSLSAASPETRAATRNVALLSVATAAILIVVKAIAWRASGSVAILASLSDSALDLIASLITVYAVRYAADLASNAVALLGVAAAAWLGLSWVDAAAGLIVALWLIWGAVGVFREASDQLLDRELPEAERERIVTLATADPRLLGVHQLRTRASGPYIHMQMHADLPADISLAEAHSVIVAAENRLLEAFPSADIIIHPDPRGLAEKHGGVFAEGVEG
jgi:divalent metal cation (Fe/Co/Zn/Cd) transporter